MCLLLVFSQLFFSYKEFTACTAPAEFEWNYKKKKKPNFYFKLETFRKLWNKHMNTYWIVLKVLFFLLAFSIARFSLSDEWSLILCRLNARSVNNTRLHISQSKMCLLCFCRKWLWYWVRRMYLKWTGILIIDYYYYLSCDLWSTEHCARSTFVYKSCNEMSAFCLNHPQRTCHRQHRPFHQIHCPIRFWRKKKQTIYFAMLN